MSVVLITKKEFSDVAKSLLYHEALKEVFLSWRERYYKTQFSKEINLNSNEILCFVERLYIANRLAYYYQYPYECQNNKIEIERLNEDFYKQGNILQDKELLRLLRLIHYNLYTNNGRIFLGKEDEERLERIITRLKDKIINGY